MKQLITLLLFTGLFLSSCGPTTRPFTKDLLHKEDWSRDKLSQVQFYLSDPIVIWRELRDSETTVNDKGAIKYVNGRKVEEITFERGLPGTFLFSPENQHFAIGFEEDSDSYLIFGPNKKMGNRYVLLAKEWNKNYGIVTYEGQEWKTSYKSAYSYLKANIKKYNKVRVQSKKAKGRTVN